MPPVIADSVRFLRENDLKTILARIRERNVPPLVQFAVYGVCGGLATAVFLGMVLILSKTVVPAYTGMLTRAEPVAVLGHPLFWPAADDEAGALRLAADPLTTRIRARNLLANNCAAFLFANLVAYVSNVLFVFKTGRHHPVLEFFYFTLVNGISFGLSQIAGPWLVLRFGVPTDLAILSNLVASILLNFAGRKFFVFKE